MRAYATRWLALIEHEKEPIRPHLRRPLKGHVLPALGHLKLRELHRGHIEAFLADKRGRGYAKNTVRLMKAAALGDALRCRGRRHHRRRTPPSSSDGARPTAPTSSGRRAPPEGAADELGAARRLPRGGGADRRYDPSSSLLAKTGLRPGEAFALKPGDLDCARAARCASSAPGASGRSSREDLRGADGGPHARLRGALAPPHAWLKTEALRAWLGRARVALPQRGGQAARRGAGAQGLQAGAQEREAPRLPSLRPPPHVRGLLLAAARPDHVRERPARPREPATTLRYYARWIPSKGTGGWICWIEFGSAVTTAEDAIQVQAGTRFGTKRPEEQFGHSRCSGSARSDWWAVKDSNLGPAD